MTTGAGGDLAERLEPHRRELVAHCYRLLGSVHEAEDLVQETMLRAWRARDRYDETRASLRTWLYSIATNACLTALEGRARRPLPSGLGVPSEDAEAPLTPSFEVPWLQPFPTDPADTVEARTGLRLALIAAVQVLPPRQRAVLVLREVLRFSAAEVASMLGASVASVNSALQRARAGLTAAEPTVSAVAAVPDDPEVRAVVDRYARAFEAADVDGLVALLTEDAVLEMPPVPLWYRGRADYGRFMARLFVLRGADWGTVPLWANGQPAFAAYSAGRLHTLQVFEVDGGRVARTVVFQDPRVFELFGLAPALPR
ncbi:sigma-70 family RNA polymerase sigma factor [Jiangella endophytica]|uniref:sigma-70 family RNA polymerase sigma factor n=1 Tax=Jiangella endophytica TaxID=1623398 RepID=UPI000E34FAB7|nr:sigma-70 family RNA polymerase sigma factor [Jiangella endophytica]